MSSLETQIQALSNLYNRVQSLRQFPPSLLKRPLASAISSPPHHPEFHHLQEISDILRSDPVQDALRAARDSQRADPTEISPSIRREHRKRRRPPSPESPQPYISSEKASKSLFPFSDHEPTPLQVTRLPNFITKFNRSHRCILHIWTRARGSTQMENPLTVRFSIPHVLIAYIKLLHSTDNPILIAESVTVFGPRENKAPYSQSDYTVFQSLSQQIAKRLQAEPNVSFQNIVNLLSSYEDLFIDRCTNCERVISAEGHIPPVVRVWTPGKDDEEGKWVARHLTCQQT